MHFLKSIDAVKTLGSSRFITLAIDFILKYMYTIDKFIKSF